MPSGRRNLGGEMAGYSGTPLWKKLGIEEGSRLALVGIPDGFEIADLPGDVTPEHDGPGPFDVILAFARDAATVDRHLAALRSRLDPAGGLWIAWPKKASGVATDVTEDGVRERGLAAGLVDNKVCAVDETWSGLRLVVRVADRPKKARP
jgi:hypothetical protein